MRQPLFKRLEYIGIASFFPKQYYFNSIIGIFRNQLNMQKAG